MADRITIDRYAPVLDFVVPVAESLARTGEALVETSAQPRFVGHAADLQKVCFMLYPYTDTEARLDGGVQKRRVTGKAGGGSVRYRLGIDFRSDWHFEEAPVPAAHHNCLIRPPSGKGRVAVTAKNTPRRESWRRDHFSDALGGRLGLAAKPAGKIELSFEYHFQPFIISTPFQDFEPLRGFRNAQGREGQNYPVSERAEYSITDAGKNFFSEPLYWNALGCLVSAIYNGISGYKPLRDFLAQHRVEDGKVRKMEPACYELIELAVAAAKRGEKADLGSFSRNLGCMPVYRGIFLKPALETLRYYMSANGLEDPARRGYAQAIVDSHNECYARPRGRPDITVREFCSIPDMV